MAHRSTSPWSRGKAGTATKGYQGGTLRSREEGSAPVAGLPFDGAAHRRHESSRRVLVSEVVLGIAFLVVRVDRHELDAFGREIFLDRDRAILPRLHIGAVVAPEGDDKDRLVLERA